MQIEEHKLTGSGVRCVMAPDYGGLLIPSFAVIHYTAAGAAEGSEVWLTRRDAAYVSAHVLIDRNGHVVQMVPFNRVAYHAGLSRWRNLDNLNQHSIGIELANYGVMESVDDKTAKAWNGALVPKLFCCPATHKNGKVSGYWERYSYNQIAALVTVLQTIAAHYQIIEIVGHDDIAPNRKTDPGPLFPMDDIRKVLDGRL